MPAARHESSYEPTRRELFFASGNDRCHAWLYVPADAEQPPPVIVMAHGLGGTKKLRLGEFASRFRAAGYACLVFDYRYFGDSSGAPRELLDIPSQLEDWRSAVAFARSLPEVDPSRVIVWGTSFGAGHAIATAAGDPEIAAAITQCPFTDGRASSGTMSLRTRVKIAGLALRDLLAKQLRLPPVRIRVTAAPGQVALMSAPGAVESVHALRVASGVDPESQRDRVAARVALQIPFHRPGRLIKNVKAPMLFCVCDADNVAPAQAALRYAAKASCGQIKRYPYGHFEIYLGESFEQVIHDQIAFLREHVPSPSADLARPRDEPLGSARAHGPSIRSAPLQ